MNFSCVTKPRHFELDFRRYLVFYVGVRDAHWHQVLAVGWYWSTEFEKSNVMLVTVFVPLWIMVNNHLDLCS